ncbi:hypothetical protein JF66_04300 [Cryobacterium sp. MLB-32]|uniref:hypothetical protein n=1 Tax=Cryobacterium sp. MLB-32 TaxID=1529318 RepID=UPI0004E650B7|nr:hypothetical protein [Cryobacterium sp. MLB-32]KFF60475.1 hypothetical protein JF66_04300 [Cryobacterium sp. MLB-32]
MKRRMTVTGLILAGLVVTLLGRRGWAQDWATILWVAGLVLFLAALGVALTGRKKGTTKSSSH